MPKGDLSRARTERKIEHDTRTEMQGTATAKQRALISKSKTMRGVDAMDQPEFQKEFCELLSDGSTIKAALRLYGLNYAKYYHYRKKNPEFGKMVDMAVDVGYDALADECIEIADKPCLSKIEVQQAKLRIETRIEILQRKSKRYNPRQQIEVTDNREVEKVLRERFVNRVETAKQAKKDLIEREGE